MSALIAMRMLFVIGAVEAAIGILLTSFDGHFNVGNTHLIAMGACFMVASHGWPNDR